MKPIEFMAIKENGVYVYVYSRYDYSKKEDNCVMEIDWPPEVTSSNNEVYESMNISYGMVHRALYYAIIFRMKNDYSLYGVSLNTTGKVDEAAVKWYYECTYNTALRDMGFTDADSYTPLVELKCLRDMVTVHQSNSGDVRSDINIYTINKTNVEKVMIGLKSNIKPEIGYLLGDDELLFNLSIAQDEGYYEGVIIHSKTDISGKLACIMKKLNHEIETFENEMANIHDLRTLMKKVGMIIHG